MTNPAGFKWESRRILRLGNAPTLCERHSLANCFRCGTTTQPVPEAPPPPEDRYPMPPTLSGWDPARVEREDPPWLRRSRRRE